MSCSNGAARASRIERVVAGVTARAKEDLIVALAELYLDTDVRTDLPRVAERIARAALPPHELQLLWRSQITPVVHWNLKAPAGEWTGFDRKWLLSEVEQRRGHRGLESWPWIGELVHRARAYAAEREFRFAVGLAARLAALPEAERPRRTTLWQALAHVYYAADASRVSQAGYDATQPDETASVQFSHRLAQQLIDRKHIEPSELLEEYRVICDVLAELLSSEVQKRVAEAHMAAWLSQLVGS
ncbi:MAG: hypothetical protein ABW321_02300 [Polyangiales bacterium]